MIKINLKRAMTLDEFFRKNKDLWLKLNGTQKDELLGRYLVDIAGRKDMILNPEELLEEVNKILK